jgi:hypothetical protein
VYKSVPKCLKVRLLIENEKKAVGRKLAKEVNEKNSVEECKILT